MSEAFPLPRAPLAGLTPRQRLVGALGAGALLALLPVPFHLFLAAASILTVGLSHGASDVTLAAPAWRRRYGDKGGALYLTVYLGVALLALAALMTAPLVMLYVFLFVSAAHFGWEDTDRTGPPRRLMAERVIRGLVPITAPALFYQGEVVGIFEIFLRGNPGAQTAGAVLTILAVPALVGAGDLVFRQWREGRARDADTLGMTAAFTLFLPPLIGFSLYFVLIHSVRALEGRAARTGTGSVPRYLMRFAPVTALGGLVLAAIGLAAPAGGAVYGLFGGLAVLTMPHCLIPRRPG